MSFGIKKMLMCLVLKIYSFPVLHLVIICLVTMLRTKRIVYQALFLYINSVFTITAEIHARSLANFYRQYADRHMNLKFMRRISKREPAIRQFVIVKNKLMSGFNVSVLLLIMNFVITLSK